MKFIILTQYYPPETGAPQNRLSDLANRLHQFGHKVSVLTALPNYPIGEIFPEYRGHLCKHVNSQGVDIYHCWIFPSRSKNMLLRLLNYFSFVLSSAILGTFLLSKADFIFVESPPLFLGLAAWWLAKIKEAQVIFNVSDLYPETAISLGYLRNRWLQKILFTFEAWCYSISSLVTGQTKGIIRSISQRFPESPAYWLTNGVDLSRFTFEDHTDQREGCGDGTFTVGYAGILGHAQNLNSVLKAAEYLGKFAPHIKLIFYGDGPLKEDLTGQIKQLNLSNVTLAGHLPHDKIILTMRSWDAGIVPLVNTPLMAGAVPSKIFEVMASGCPVILYTPEGEASDLVLAANAGIWVCADQSYALANMIAQLAEDKLKCKDFGKNGRAFVTTHFDRVKIAQKFVDEVSSLLEDRNHGLSSR